MIAKSGNTGLTVKINLWPLAKYLNDFNAESARLWIKGQVTNADTKEAKKFNDPGELITVLARWNVKKFQELKKKAKKKKIRLILKT